MRGQEADPRALRVWWGVEAPSARGPASRYSLRAVAEAAVAIADEEGLEAVTLARVAAALGLATTALYRYVESKALLVELMTDVALGEPPTQAPGAWTEASRDWALALADRYRRHPWLARVEPAGAPRTPAAFAWIAALTEAVGDRAGDAARIALLLESIVRGYSALARVGDGAAVPPWLGEQLVERFPHAVQTPQAWTDPTDELAFAIDTALAGLRARSG